MNLLLTDSIYMNTVLYGLLFSEKPKKIHTDQSTLQVLYSV